MSPETYIETVLPKMEGWCSPEKAARLVKLVADESIRVFVEIGVFGGRSLFAVALAQQKIDVRNRVYGYQAGNNWVVYGDDDPHYEPTPISTYPISIGIDPWCASDSVKGFSDANADWWANVDHEKIYSGCRCLISSLGLDSKCHLIRSNSAHALSLISRIGPLDMLHIDGNHSEEASCFDVEAYMPLVRNGGIILFDDADWYTTKKAIELLDAACDRLEPTGNCLIFRKR